MHFPSQPTGGDEEKAINDRGEKSKNTFEFSLPVANGTKRHADQEGTLNSLHFEQMVQKSYHLQ